MNFDYNFGNDYYKYLGKIGWKCTKYKIMTPAQSQPTQPGMEYLMNPLPIFDNPNYKGSGKLNGKVIIITGGDSGLGRAAAIAFVKEGAKVVIPYYNEHKDANDTKTYLEKLGGECLLLSGDISDKNFCKKIVSETLKCYGRIDVLVNNAGVQYHLTKAVLPYLKSGASIINLSSVTTFYGDPQLIDYVTTKGAIVGFTRSLARNLALKNIRVNAIAPGFFWTPLQPACWVAEKIPSLGSDAAMGRGAMPYELAPTFVFLASDDSSYMTGQVIHNNGGQVMG